MTLISFVVPAFRVQGYLRECLDSSSVSRRPTSR